MDNAQPSQSWVIILESRRQRQCAEAGLVLSALELEHRITSEGGRWRLAVPRSIVEQARSELAAYAEENRLPSGARSLGAVESGWNGVIAYVGVLLLSTVAMRQRAFDHDWLAAGRLQAGRVLDGEWWRTITALTLHVDLDHLVANLAFGSFFGLFVGRYLGSGVGWATILAAGALGNLINAAAQPALHRSIGASTAVFGALGVLAAYTWRRGFWETTPWRVRIAPVIAGVALLAYTGTGGENTDLIAHLTGFIAGFALGIIHAYLELPRGVDAQRWAALGSVGCLIGAWYWAFL